MRVITPDTFMSRFFPLLNLLLFALGGMVGNAQENPAPELPKVLLIGDSISAGYQRQVKEAFKGRAVVVKNEGNAEWSGTGIQKIESYLGATKWDVIHFNWGLWDLYGWEYHREDRSPEAYAKRLDVLVTRMKQTGAKLIWATTTPVCREPEKTMQKRFSQTVQISLAQQKQYADAALAVMKKHHVMINDLHAHILPSLSEHAVAPNDVHFHAAGSDHLAKKVIAAIDEALKSQK